MDENSNAKQSNNESERKKTLNLKGGVGKWRGWRREGERREKRED